MDLADLRARGKPVGPSGRPRGATARRDDVTTGSPETLYRTFTVGSMGGLGIR